MTFERWFAKRLGVDLRTFEVEGFFVLTTVKPDWNTLTGRSEGFTRLNRDWVEEMRQLYLDRQRLRRRLK